MDRADLRTPLGSLDADADDLFQQEPGRFVQFDCAEGQFIGLTREITVGDSEHLIAAMLPMHYYERIVRQSQLNTAGVLLLLTLLFFAVCVYLSHRYVTPIQRGLSSLKADETERAPSNIPEIDDLFAYLATKDRLHEEEISRLQSESADVQRERERAESALSNLHATGMQEILCINSNTIKYHNRNLYDKLGVHSRKELLKYATLMTKTEQEPNG